MIIRTLLMPFMSVFVNIDFATQNQFFLFRFIYYFKYRIQFTDTEFNFINVAP